MYSVGIDLIASPAPLFAGVGSAGAIATSSTGSAFAGLMDQLLAVLTVPETPATPPQVVPEAEVEEVIEPSESIDVDVLLDLLLTQVPSSDLLLPTASMSSARLIEFAAPQSDGSTANSSAALASTIVEAGPPVEIPPDERLLEIVRDLAAKVRQGASEESYPIRRLADVERLLAALESRARETVPGELESIARAPAASIAKLFSRAAVVEYAPAVAEFVRTEPADEAIDLPPPVVDRQVDPRLSAIPRERVGVAAGLEKLEAPATARIETLAHDVVRAVRLTVANGEKSLTVRLVPESLGEMRLEVSTHHQGLAVKVIAASPWVREALEMQAAGLREALVKQGIEIVQLTVAGQGPGGAPGDAAQGRYLPAFQPPPTRSIQRVTSSIEAAEQARPVSSGRLLDVHV